MTMRGYEWGVFADGMICQFPLFKIQTMILQMQNSGVEDPFSYCV